MFAVPWDQGQFYYQNLILPASRVLGRFTLKWFFASFQNHLIKTHEEKTKEITTMKKVWICDPSYHKIL